MNAFRAGVVNDLALARMVLRKVVESSPGWRVAWEAADGAEAVEKTVADRPDVVLMDLVMPGVNGAEATRRIMARKPCPILVVTASVGANHGLVFEALGVGGLDAVTTPTLGPGGSLVGAEPILSQLSKLKRAATNLIGPSGVFPMLPSSQPVAAPTGGPPLLAVGSSTGGPEAVARVFADLGPPPGPAVVVQHIGADFTQGLADWLASRTRLTVRVPKGGEKPASGIVYVAGGDDHLVLAPDGRFEYTPHPTDYPYRPSVNVFFESAGRAWPGGGVAVLLTGMGSDGARGLLALKNRGWHTVAQDEATSVVYGMPKAAAERGAAVEVLPLGHIGQAVRGRLSGRKSAADFSLPPVR